MLEPMPHLFIALYIDDVPHGYGTELKARNITCFQVSHASRRKMP
jgi:hypothetical protein